MRPNDRSSKVPILPFLKGSHLPVIEAFFKVLAEPKDQVDCIDLLTELSKENRSQFDDFHSDWALPITVSTVSPLCPEAQSKLFAALIGLLGQQHESGVGKVWLLSADMRQHITEAIMNNEL